MKTTEKNGAKVKVDGDGVDEEAAAQQAEDVAGAVAGEGGDDDEQEEVDAVAQAVADEAAEAVIAGDDSQTPSKRRFFPRVKHLLTPEWEFVSVNEGVSEENRHCWSSSRSQFLAYPMTIGLNQTCCCSCR